MSSAFMRRSGLTVAFATLVAVASPLLGQASAATFTGSVSSSPAKDASGNVAANRPTLTGTFSDNLKSGAITVYDKADPNKTDVCGGSVVSGKTVSCTAPADLSTTKTYDAVAQAVRASDGASATTPVFEFKVDYPVFDAANSKPKPQESILSGTGTLTAAFNEAITGDPATAFQVYELNADGTRGNGPLLGTVSFPTTGLPPGPGKTVTFKPNSLLVDGEYEAVVTVNGVNTDGSKNAAAIGRADYDFFISTVGPKNLSSQPLANNTNASAFPFTGTAAPGSTVTVTVPQGQPADTFGPVSGSGVVPDCGAAPDCPWTVNVDVSGLSDNTTSGYGWTAQASDGTNKSPVTSSSPKTFKIDQTAPGKPTSGSASIESNQLNVDVSAGHPSDTDFAGFTVTITDPEGHTSTKEFETTGDLSNGQVDVSGLDDGDLTVAIMSRDFAGNQSQPFTSGIPASQPSVTKNLGLQPNFDTSQFISGHDFSFTDAQSHPVQPPTQIVVEFNQAITKSYTPLPSINDPNPSPLDSNGCITDPRGNCIQAVTVADDPNDDHRLTLTPPKLADGLYGMRVTTYSASCPNSPCEKYSQTVTVPGTSTVFNYTVDGTKPNVAITGLTNPITPTLLQTAGIQGTADSDVKVIQLTLKSSGDPTHTKVATADVTSGHWKLQPLPLSGVADGLLTITASGSDAAGNTTTATKATTLSGLALSVAAGDGKILLAWQRPTLAGNATPSYSVTQQDLTTGTPAQPVSPPPASSKTSFLISNLVNGHVYRVTLRATDPNGNGPVAIRTATPSTPTKLTDYSTAHTITYGQAVLLHGRLTDAAGHGVGGMTLSLYPVYAGGRKGGAAHPATNATGYWSFSTKPIANASYVIAFAGKSGFGPSSGVTGEVVKVAIKITSLTASSSSHTSAVRMVGSVSPNEHGRHVYIYEIRSGKSVRIAMVTLGTHSMFSYTHAWSAGKHTVFARFYSQNGVTGNNSPTVTFSRS